MSLARKDSEGRAGEFAGLVAAQGRGHREGFGRRLSWGGRLSLSVLALYALVAVFAPVLAPHGQSQIVGGSFETWSRTFPLGTDHLGRDMLSRLIYGARNTIGIALAATGLAFLFGMVAGLGAATLGGVVDRVVSRLVDVLMAIPQLVFALLLLSILGASVPVLIAVIAVSDATRVFRVVRAAALGAAASDYVEAARLRGEGPVWIAAREILPNIAPLLLAEFGLRFAFVFLFISSLSFLGLGLQPPLADWGTMVRENAALIAYGDLTPLLPAGAIAVLALAANFTVDCLIDPERGADAD